MASENAVELRVVQVLSETGVPFRIFSGGEDVTLEVEVFHRAPLASPTLEISIRDRWGGVLLSRKKTLHQTAGASTKEGSLETQFRITMPRARLGEYRLSAHLSGDRNGRWIVLARAEDVVVLDCVEALGPPAVAAAPPGTTGGLRDGSAPAPMLRLGTYYPLGNQAPLDDDAQQMIDAFHRLYYARWRDLDDGLDTQNLSWFGYKLLKCPMDLWVYQEIITRTRPEVIVECGTRYGGSALYMASLMDLLGKGRVITIDIEPRDGRPDHPRITYLTGSSTDAAIIDEVHEMVASEPGGMVVLDSDHAAAHVHAEILAYQDVVGVGNYLVVEDTNLNGHPALPGFGPGPMEAVERFLGNDRDFEVDRRCERFLMTLNPRGYLRRLR